jgi:periplasmic divalent cation tolerance protein
MSKTRFVTLSTTLAKPGQASRLARKIVESRLAACVQFWPIHSVYRWKGKMESSKEITLVCKTRAGLAQALMEFIHALHPYEVPEVVVTPLAGGLATYLGWIEEETTGRQPRLTFAPAPTKKSLSRKGRKA